MRPQKFDRVSAAGNKTTGAGKRFRKTAADDVDLIADSKMVSSSPTLTSEYTQSMGIIKHDESAMPLGGYQEIRARRNVSLHRIHALDD